MKKHILGIVLIAGVLASCDTKKNVEPTSDFPDWAWADFQRPEGTNPIISPDSTTRFYCPLTKDSVDWESNDTFNPAATVYDGKVVVLYRAEDKTGHAIGGTVCTFSVNPLRYSIPTMMAKKNWSGRVDVKILVWQLPRMVCM